MIVARPDLVPLPSVLPVVFAQLPLKEDHEEYPIVYRDEWRSKNIGHRLRDWRWGILADL